MESDGRELYFLAPDGTLSAVAVTTGAQFESGIPARLFDAQVATNFAGRRQYAVTGDGKRFLFIAPPASAEAAPIRSSPTGGPIADAAYFLVATPRTAPAIIRLTAAIDNPPSSVGGMVAKPIADAFA